MFLVGVAFLVIGYAAAYHGVDVLSWSRSSVADHTRPVPLQYLIGFPLPTTPPKDAFYPPFRFTAVDQANAVSALGGAVRTGGSNLSGGAVAAPPGSPSDGANNGVPPGFNPNDPNQGILPVAPGDPGSVGGPPAQSGGGPV